MSENNGIQMAASSSHIPIAQPVSSEQIDLSGQITDIDDDNKVEATKTPIDNAAPLGSNDDDYCTICCCCLCAYTEISCPEKVTDCCRFSCCSCSVKCMDDCGDGRRRGRGGNTYIFFYSDGNTNHNNNVCCYNDNCCCCFNCGDGINNMINACTNIPCSCECCNALPNLNIFDNNICEVVSAVFQVVYEVLNFVLTLFRD